MSRSPLPKRSLADSPLQQEPTADAMAAHIRDVCTEEEVKEAGEKVVEEDKKVEGEEKEGESKSCSDEKGEQAEVVVNGTHHAEEESLQVKTLLPSFNNLSWI